MTKGDLLPHRETIYDLDLNEQVAVVIGGSEGIGAAIARGLAKAGATVALGGRSLERLSAVAADLGTLGADAPFASVDVRNPDDIDRFAHWVAAKVGVPTILVNSMGGQLSKRAMEVSVTEWDMIQETHLRGTFFACRAFAMSMKETGYGKIINLSSTYSIVVVEQRSVYAAAKAGISQLTSALALEWGPLGIRVNALAPGTTRTTRVKELFEVETERETTVAQATPLRRIAETDDVVGPALFLATSMSDFVTGQTLVVDGGWARVR